ncbi:MAG: helix-turn-helix domain-containing protein [Armatimonadetes bacterium]|nr:helix-turn-helix domain-containing protein [Armatimonadota bacterium]
MASRLLKIKEVVEETGISRSKLHQFIRRGDLRTVYVGKSPRIRPEDLEDFIERLGDDCER